MVKNVYSSTIPTKDISVSQSNENTLFIYLRKISQYPVLSQLEEKELAKAYKAGDIEAKEKLIQSNLRLVVQIAKRAIHKSNVPIIDLIQEGNLSLITAIEKFNWEYGYKFSTYASWWIRQSMFKAISEQSFCVKIPVYIQETLSRYNKAKKELENKKKKAPTMEEISKLINVPAKKIDEYLNTYTQSLSLDAPIELNNDNSANLSDILVDNTESIQIITEKKAVKEELLNLITSLKEREKNVLTWRFGLEDIRKYTLEEIGQFYGVTKECIRQTELRAIRKLKAAIETDSILSNYYPKN